MISFSNISYIYKFFPLLFIKMISKLITYMNYYLINYNEQIIFQELKLYESVLLIRITKKINFLSKLKKKDIKGH